jgi:hypothetical protein
MRAVMLLLIAACLASPLATTSAQATATLRPLGIETQANGVVEVANRRCGRGHHWAGGHRARNGHWIRGHCVRNYRRR